MILMYTPDWIQQTADRIAGDIVNAPAPERGPRIQAYRNKSRLTQEELSHIMRLRRESISRIEHGRVTPTVAFIHVFAGVMALMEAVKAYRSQNKGVEYPYFVRIGAELGVPPDSIAPIVDLALQSYERKRKSAIRSLEG
ncbi:MAG TPA: helix-turn-helix domain-containing protein [Methanocella sp.]|nr:helix-turn-helix domain-containing protein [Methanocella sp.]